MSARRWLLALLALPACSGCIALSGQVAPPAPLPPPERVAGVVFCADGSGGLGGTTQVLQAAVADRRLPLRVEMVAWSHGTGRFLADHFHWRNIERHGLALAGRARAWRAHHPDKRVYFV